MRSSAAQSTIAPVTASTRRKPPNQEYGPPATARPSVFSTALMATHAMTDFMIGLSGWPVLTRLVASSTRKDHRLGSGRSGTGPFPCAPRRRTSCQHPRRSLTLVIVALVLLLAACGKTPPVVAPTIVEVIKTVEVKIPIQVKAEPPPELLAPIKIPLPVFVAPSDAETSSALTVEGERLLRGLIEDLLQRLAAWKAWAEAK